MYDVKLYSRVLTIMCMNSCSFWYYFTVILSTICFAVATVYIAHACMIVTDFNFASCMSVDFHHVLYTTYVYFTIYIVT